MTPLVASGSCAVFLNDLENRDLKLRDLILRYFLQVFWHGPHLFIRLEFGEDVHSKQRLLAAELHCLAVVHNSIF